MLNINFTDIAGVTVALAEPLSLTLNAQEDVPADDITAIFPYKKIDELAEVTVSDGDEVIFRGVVDEQQTIFAPAGMYLRVAARSMAAHLLDNEAVPTSYNHPTSGLIFERHAKDYGLSFSDDSESAYFGEMVVTKGMTEWQVIESFALMCYAARPRVSALGELSMRGLSHGDTVCFSDTGEGIRYTELTESIKRCEEISRVNVRVNAATGYLTRVDNPDALSRGICRERYLNAALTDTPMYFADSIIDSGRLSGYSIRLTVPQRLSASLGAQARIKDTVLGEIEGLYVCSLRYTLSSSGESTELVLRRRVG